MILHSPRSPPSLPLHFPNLLTSCNLILHSIIARLPHLRLEVKINQLPLLSSPLPIRVPIVDHISTASIPDLGCGVAQCPLGRPLDGIAGRLGDEEGFGAPLVAVAVDTFPHREVEDLARCYFGGCGLLVGEMREGTRGRTLGQCPGEGKTGCEDGLGGWDVHFEVWY